MELQTARQIIDTLSRGVHPVTGEAMPPDSPYNEPDVIRALFVVSQALEAKPPGAQRALPANAGKPWEAHEDVQLTAAHHEGKDVKAMAEQFARTPFAVEARLVKMGLLAPRAGMRMPAPATA